MVRLPGPPPGSRAGGSRRRSPGTSRQPSQVDEDLAGGRVDRCRPGRCPRPASRTRRRPRRAARRCASRAGDQRCSPSPGRRRAPRPARSGRSSGPHGATSNAYPAGPAPALPQGHRVEGGDHPARWARVPQQDQPAGDGRVVRAVVGRRQLGAGRAAAPVSRSCTAAVRLSCMQQHPRPVVGRPGHAQQHRGRRDRHLPAGGAGDRVDRLDRALDPAAGAGAAHRRDGEQGRRAGDGDDAAGAPPLRRRRWPARRPWCPGRPGCRSTAASAPGRRRCAAGRSARAEPACQSQPPVGQVVRAERAVGLGEQVPVVGQRVRVGRADRQAEHRGQRRRAAAPPRPPRTAARARR